MSLAKRGTGSNSVLLNLAGRMFFKKSSEGIISFVSSVSIVGVALGVTALVVVTSVINGFEYELKRAITRMNGDIIVYSKNAAMEDYRSFGVKTKRLDSRILGVTYSLVEEVMISGPRGVSGGVLEGLDFSTVREATGVTDALIEGRMPESPTEVVLGNILASEIGVGVGKWVRLIVPHIVELNGPKMLDVRVVGIIQMGLHQYDSKFVFGTLSFAQNFLLQPEKINTLKLKVKENVNSRNVAALLSDKVNYPFRVKHWSELNRNLFYAIELEKVVISIILAAIVLVAAMNMVSALMMMMHDRAKEIAILKAVGLSSRQSFVLFCLVGSGIGLFGIILGLLGGLGLNELISVTDWLRLPPDVYYLNTGFFPVRLRPYEIVLIVIFTFFVCFSASLYPGFKVSRSSPAEGLRYE